MDKIKYTTVQGDTFPLVSFKAYGDERFSNILIHANAKYANVIVFDSDITLWIPFVEETEFEEIPPWRR